MPRIELPTIRAEEPRLNQLQFVEASAEPLDILAAEDGSSRRRFTIVGYTGGLLRVAGWWRPVVIDLSGMEIPNQRIPALRNHDIERIVGHTEGIEKTAQRLKLSGVISADTEDSRAVISLAAGGFPWKASVGASVLKAESIDAGSSVNVNGRRFDGPITVARRTLLGEISFVPMGADAATSAVVAHQSEGGNPVDPKFVEWLRAKGIDPDSLNDTVRRALEAAWKSETSPPTPTPQPTPVPQSGQQPAQQPVQASGQSMPAQGNLSLDAVAAQHKAEIDRQNRIIRLVDDAIQAQPDMLDDLRAMAEAAIKDKSSVESFELALLRASRPTPAQVGGGRTPFGGNGRLPDDQTVIEAAVCMAAGDFDDVEKIFPERVLEAANRRWRHGLGLEELFLTFARRNGHSGLSMRDTRAVLRAAFAQTPFELQANAIGPSTSGLSNILSNVANKFLVMGFMAVEQAWREVGSRRNVSDFKTINSYSLVGDLDYEEVGPGGELKHGKLGEVEYSNQAKTYARMLGLDRRDLINDDLGALSGAGRRLGRGAGTKLNKVFWTEFLDNATFWTAGNGGFIDGATTALSSEGLRQGVEAFDNQTDPDGQPVGLDPKILLVPTSLRSVANELFVSTNIAVGGGSSTDRQPDKNVYEGLYRPVVSRYLGNSAYTGFSTTAWYLLADPNELSVIEVAFLFGMESPTVETAEADFSTLGIAMRGFHDFGVSKQEYRGGIKSKGAA